MSIHVGSKEDLGDYVGDGAIVNSAISDEERRNQRKSNDKEMFMDGATSVRGAYTIYETALEKQEQESPGSFMWIRYEKQKKKELKRVQDLCASEHPAKREGAEYIRKEYQAMSPQKRRQEYASTNPDVLHDPDLSSEMLNESTRGVGVV